jgi:uncharacterized protein YndB with AHSA1/START domain
MTLELNRTFTLPAAPDRVFQALIDERELRAWFAEHVRVEPKPKGAYQFWGKATLGAPQKASDASQVLTHFEAGKSLAFGWTLYGQSSEVGYVLSPGEAPDTTTLTLRHLVHGALPFRSPKDVIDDVWKIHFANLAEHLRGRTGAVVLADFTNPKPEVRVSIEIAAPPAKVFRALLEPALMNQWLFGAAVVDKAKGVYSYGWKYDYEGKSVLGGPTRILEMVENERLVTDWPDWRGDETKPVTKVTWTLEPLDGGSRTRVTLVHDGFEHMADRSDYLSGWAGFLDGLVEVVLRPFVSGGASATGVGADVVASLPSI